MVMLLGVGIALAGTKVIVLYFMLPYNFSVESDSLARVNAKPHVIESAL